MNKCTAKMDAIREIEGELLQRREELVVDLEGLTGGSHPLVKILPEETTKTLISSLEGGLIELDEAIRVVRNAGLVDRKTDLIIYMVEGDLHA